ncbi:hypothetical protein BN946_scf185002.g22 [Trametes cinnabarina]|uniref:Tc1-like transposase DDE domain-containing protein n=1 Tax=Pycnoporus cinnabarinus TaxID=5643 RepID=A0A060SEE4_PYCCI|nr:hypothetical protein BN946_scf185002.g22 [Trametes cinnabarina]
MDAKMYRHILEDSLLGTLHDHRLGPSTIIFQHDNDPKHTARLVQEWLEHQNLLVLPWPPSSPDLNIIENVWAEIKKRLETYRPRPRNTEELWRVVQKLWQGRRNPPEAGVQLLDDDGAISVQHIFAKYCTPKAAPAVHSGLLEPPEGAYLTSEGLDSWARDTNGAPFDEATKEEILEFMDVTEDGGLTFKGFMQVYQLQTENDEEETWRDLADSHLSLRMDLTDRYGWLLQDERMRMQTLAMPSRLRK